ncbi:MAG: SGNH/GDSL hydrolase family protein [Eubacteriales bacterium]
MCKYNELFHGHNHLLYEEDGGIIPMRFSVTEFQYYSAIGEVETVRAYIPAGIRFSFYTESDNVNMRFRLFNFIRPQASFSLMENDEMMEEIIVTDQMERVDICYRKKNKGQVKIDLYLPHMVAVSLMKFDVNDAISVPKKEKTLLSFGDSITQGAGCEICARSYTNQLSIELGMELYNKGVGGYIFDADSIERTVEPDIITIAYGTNDFSRWHDLEKTISDARKYCAKIKELFPDVPVYMMTPLWRADLLDEEKTLFHQFTKALLTVAEEFQFPSVAGEESIPHEEVLFDDKVHPLAAGCDFVAKALLKIMK